jgi:hypothetical protein
MVQPSTLIVDDRRCMWCKGKCLDFDATKVYSSLSRFEAPVEIFFGHLREGRGVFIILVLRHWHTFDVYVLRAQDLIKGKELLLWLR